MRIGILSAELGQEDAHENKRLALEIRLRGHSPKIINYHKTVIVTTKNKRELYQPDKRGVLQRVKVNAVIPRINEADEQSINLASMALEVLIKNGVYSTATPSSIRLAKNKIGTLMCLAGDGIPIPRSAAITGTESHIDIDKVLKIVEPAQEKRIIVKTNVGTHGKGVMSANTRGEARAIVDGFLANNIPVMLQEFMEPTKKSRYIDLRFVIANGKCVGAMERMSAKRDEIRANISLGGLGSPYEATAEEMKMAERAAKAVGLSVVAGVDVIPSGHKRLVIEVNASPGFMIEELTGVNLAAKIVRQAISNATRSSSPVSNKIIETLNAEIALRPKGPIAAKLKTPFPGALKNIEKVTRRTKAK
jgi:ribosomal protein S6--L-glutamate ligase